MAVLLFLAASLVVAAWRLKESSSGQRSLAEQWSLLWILLWSLAFGYVLLVNYPIPPQAHHTDKFLIGIVLALIWSLWLALHPESLGPALGGRMYAWLKIGVINVVVFVLVGEATMQAADPLLARSGLFGDKHTPASLKPHTKVLGSIGVANSQGFRDRERVFERSRFAARIVALGDSFTWGSGVSYDQAFVTLVEQGLNESAPAAEIINLGVPAWGPHEEFHLLKAYGVRFSPDVVMLNFFIGNDIQNKRGDDFNLPEIKVVAGQSYYVHSNGNFVHDTVGLDRWFLYHNLNYLIRVGSSQLWRVAQRRESAVSDEVSPLVSRTQYLKGIYERSDIYLRESSPFFTHHWSRTQAALLSIRDFLRERGIPLMIVMIPEHIQLDSALQSEYLASVGALRERYDFQKPQRLLLAWCAAHGVDVVDLLPSFQAEGNPASLHFRNDFHWSIAGHKVAADALLPVLRKRLRHSIGVVSDVSG
ncbi:MAG: SGNH/GDSL hydrolase family protein [Nitrospiraceae bacterium]